MFAQENNLTFLQDFEADASELLRNLEDTQLLKHYIMVSLTNVLCLNLNLVLGSPKSGLKSSLNIIKIKRLCKKNLSSLLIF